MSGGSLKVEGRFEADMEYYISDPNWAGEVGTEVLKWLNTQLVFVPSVPRLFIILRCPSIKK